eukprot:SAG22_NODE_8378_length_660_cov_1.089127_1_plen_187_part_01
MPALGALVTAAALAGLVVHAGDAQHQRQQAQLRLQQGAKNVHADSNTRQNRVPPPPGPVARHASAHSGSRLGKPSVSVPSLQGVAMPTLDPEYRYFDEVWDWLRILAPQQMLFGPWFVFPRYATQELWPPSPHLCGHLNGDAFGNRGTLSLACAEGEIEAVEAAWWGETAGFCGNFTPGPANCSVDV